MKRCPKCRNTLTFESFGRDKRRKDGMACWCRECSRANIRRYRATDDGRRKHLEQELARYAANPEPTRQRSAAWEKANPERVKANRLSGHRRRMICPVYRMWQNLRVSEWTKRDASRWAAKNARSRAAKRCAVPAWLTIEHRAEIKAIYAEAARLTRELGVPHHVDHIIPLRAKVACGLHVPWNLRVVTADFNLTRRNRMPEDPSEWIAFAEAA